METVPFCYYNNLPAKTNVAQSMQTTTTPIVIAESVNQDLFINTMLLNSSVYLVKPGHSRKVGEEVLKVHTSKRSAFDEN